MTKHFPPSRLRGVASVRADASNPATILAELQKTFQAFKDERDKEMADLKKGMGDYVQSDKVDRINAEISSLQASLDDVNRALAAATIGGDGSAAPNAAVAEHARAFNTWFRRGDRAIDADMRQLEVNAALSTDSDPDGGYTVPEQMSNEIDRVLGTVSAMRSISNVMQISAPTYKKLVNLAGTASGWVTGRGSRPETVTANLSELAFELMELYANPAATQRTLDDSFVNIEQWLANEVAVEFAEQEGAAFVAGDGVGKPRGILSYPTITNGSYAWGKIGFAPSKVAAALSDGSNNGTDALMDLYYSLKSGYRMGATWMMSDIVQGAVRKLKDGDGTYLWAPPTATSELATMFGKPVVTDDNMPAIEAGKFPIAFGNFQRGYLIVDGPGIRVLRDPFTNKPYVHFYTTKRVGGGVQDFEAMKLLKIAAS